MPLTLALSEGEAESAPVVESDGLRLNGWGLVASPQGTQALIGAIVEAGGSFSAEFWFRAPEQVEHGGPLIFGFGDDGFGVFVTHESDLVVMVNTTIDRVNLTRQDLLDNKWHHVVTTYRSGLAALVTLYVDGLPIMVSGDGGGTAPSAVTWPTNKSLQVGTPWLQGLSFGAAAWFARELDAATVKARHARGPSR